MTQKKKRNSRKYAKPRRTTAVKSDEKEDIDIVGGRNDGDGALIIRRRTVNSTGFLSGTVEEEEGFLLRS